MIIKKEILNVKGKELLLRTATEEDAEMLIDYLKITATETPFLVKEPEEITLTKEQEIRFINGNNESEEDLLLLGFVDGKHIGNCSLMGNVRKRYRHRVTIGIALYEEYTGQGFGRAMMEKVITVAKDMGFEQVELEVVAANDRAIHLYESLGFVRYGTFPNNMRYKDGTYDDAHWMMKKL